RRVGLGVPVAQRADVVGGDVGAVLGAQQGFQQDLEAVRQTLGSLDLVQAEDLVRLLADPERVAGSEAVNAGRGHRIIGAHGRSPLRSRVAGKCVRVVRVSRTSAGEATWGEHPDTINSTPVLFRLQ